MGSLLSIFRGYGENGGSQSLLQNSRQISFGKAIKLKEFGGFEKLEVCDVDSPQHPGAKSVLIKMKACALNFSDMYVRMGLFTFHNIKPPFVMGSEGAGIIVEVGENVSSFRVEDHVLCWNFTYGIWAEYVILPADQCYSIPKGMTFEEAASIVNNYVTAYFAVLDFGNLRPGQSILIQAAAGGVGWAATQLAKTVNNVTVFGTASSSKHEAIKENGVTHAIDYHSLDFANEVVRLSPHGVNVVVDSLSGSNFMRSHQLLKNMGRLIHIGASSMICGEKKSLFEVLKVWWQVKDVPVLNLINKNYAVCGLNIANLHEQDPCAFRSALEAIMQLYIEGRIKPKIDSVWPFAKIVDATNHMLTRRNTGKIIIFPQLDEEKDHQDVSQND